MQDNHYVVIGYDCQQSNAWDIWLVITAESGGADCCKCMVMGRKWNLG